MPLEVIGTVGPIFDGDDDNVVDVDDCDESLELINSCCPDGTLNTFLKVWLTFLKTLVLGRGKGWRDIFWTWKKQNREGRKVTSCIW